MYGLYTMNINNKPATANTILKTGFKLKKVDEECSLNNDSLYSHDNLVFEVSGTRNNFGTITHCSHSCMKFLKKSERDIIGMDLSRLLPKAIQEYHKNWMLTHFETGKSTVLDRIRKDFVYIGSQIIRPVELMITTYPNFDKRMKYFALMRPVQDKREYILLKADGTVDGYT